MSEVESCDCFLSCQSMVRSSENNAASHSYPGARNAFTPILLAHFSSLAAAAAAAERRPN